MALTDADLDRIDVRLEGTIERTVERVVHRVVEGVVERVVERVIDKKDLATKTDLNQLGTKLEARMDRMESRLLFGMSLLERDGFEQLEDHERRIRQLEELQASP